MTISHAYSTWIKPKGRRQNDRRFPAWSITRRDLEQSIDFYERLGLKVVKRIPDVREDGIARAFKQTQANLTVAYLAPPHPASKLFIDLVQWLEPSAIGQAYPALNHVGLNLLAFRVRDIDATVSALREQAISFLSQESQVFGPGIRSIVTNDPDGVFIQLIEGL
jgi:catechol 2,3-dioxygenase-like lactoylglutathione lyase family enzyme